MPEVGKELGRRWRDLDLEERERYLTKANENRVQYNQDRLKKLQDDLNLVLKDMQSDPHSVVEKLQDDLNSVQPELQDQLNMEVENDNDSLGEGSTAQLNSPKRTDKDDTGSYQVPNESIRLENLGFAKQGKYPWHPALRTGEIANGSRVRVTYFGSGETGIVNKSNWVVYSKQVEERVKTSAVMKNSSFKLGLNQMKVIIGKLIDHPDSQITSPAIEITPQNTKRQFRSLDKDRLQKEDEENLQLLAKKMSQDSTLMWFCKDCNWKSEYTHKAKAHARICGRRKMYNPKKCEKKKFQCSSMGCNLTFPSKSKLKKHYR